MDGHGIPIVTSNHHHSKSIFKIPACEYSIECPESKRFESYGTSNINDNGNQNGNGKSSISNTNDNDDGGAVLIMGNGTNNSSNSGSSGYINGVDNDLIPSCNFTKPIPFAINSTGNDSSTSSGMSATNSTATASMMNAIGQDQNKKWDAILSIRYYDIIKRLVHYEKNNSNTNQACGANGVNSANGHNNSDSDRILKTKSKTMVVITTTITTVADLQIQITPTSKPFTSAMNESPSSYSSQYNHSITLFAKSYTSEHNLEQTEKEQDQIDMKTMKQIQEEQTVVENPNYTWSDVIPQIIFSSNDNRYISCVVPHPIPVREEINSIRKTSSLSSIVIFSLDWKMKRNLNSSSRRTGPGMTTSSSSSSLQSMSPLKSKNKTKYTRIPLPFYIKETFDEEMEKQQQRHLSNSSIMEKENTKSPSKKSSAKNLNKFLPAMNSILSQTNPPTICNPRTVSIGTQLDTFGGTSGHNDDHDDEDGAMKYKRAIMLLTQITTISDINANTTSVDNNDYYNDFKYPNIDANSNTNDDEGSNMKGKRRNAHPLLLAGCTDGSILLLGYKRAKLLTLLYDHKQEEKKKLRVDETLQHDDNSTWVQSNFGINQMMYMYSPDQRLESESISNENGNSLDGFGRLIIIQRDGQVAFYRTQFRTSSPNSQQHSPKHPISIQPFGMLLKERGLSHHLSPFVHGVFLDYNIIGFLVHPLLQFKSHENDRTLSDNHNNNDTIVQVWHIDCNRNQFVLMNALKMNDERLLDLNHGFLSMKKGHDRQVDELGTRLEPKCIRYVRANFKLQYEKRTNSLVVSSAVAVNSNSSSSFRMTAVDQGAKESKSNIFLRPFVSVWKWRTSVLGFTLLGESFMKYTFLDDNDINEYQGQRSYLMNDWAMVGDEKKSYSLQNICLCQDASRGYTLSYISESDDQILQKELHSVGLLSPSSTNACTHEIHEPSSIFLTHDTISYLDSLPASVTKEMTIQWKQSQVPSSYRSSNGCLQIAAIGKNGRSIAVAASRGFCVLDLSIGRDDCLHTKTYEENGFPSSCIDGFKCTSKGSSSGVGSSYPKWRMFNEIDEAKFIVQTMTWWENCSKKHGSSEDILLCAVEYADEGSQQYYLAGWSKRRLAMEKFQLLQNLSSSKDMPKKGVKLPYGFIPKDISIICEPTQRCSRAVVLLTSKGSTGMNYVLCQLQSVDDEEENQGINDFRVLANVICVDSVNYHSLAFPSSSTNPVETVSSVFFAGTAFHYNLLSITDAKHDSDSIATIGILYNLGQSVASLGISSSGKTCLKNIFQLAKKSEKIEEIKVVEKIWLSDVSFKYSRNDTNKEYCMNWSFLISGGGNLIWSVPSDDTIDGPEDKDPVVIGPMQLFPDDDPEKSKVFLGSLPLASDRFLIYSAQERRKFHRHNVALNDEISNLEDTSIFGISDCVIGVPSFTPSLILQLSLRCTDNKGRKKNPITSLKRKKCYDSTTAAIRVIVSFITDQLYRLRNVRSVDRLSFYERMLADIVGLTKSSLSTVQFACIYLSIARQLEHHHLDQLFPLPLQSEAALNYITVKDLFTTSVNKRTLPVASSSLPIFTSTAILHEHCLDLLHHCVTTVLNFVAAVDSTNLWCIREECFFLQQIYNYTAKLEDSFEAQQYHYDDSFATQQSRDGSSFSSNVSVDESGIEHSYVSESSSAVSISESIDSLESDTSFAEITVEMKSSNRISRFASVLTPSFLRSRTPKDDELAIAEAASTFVLSGFQEDSVQADSTHEAIDISSAGSILHDDSISVDHSAVPTMGSVSEMLGKAIASSIFSTVENKSKWNGLNQIAVLCTLLQSHNNDRQYELDIALDLIQCIHESSYERVLNGIDLGKNGVETYQDNDSGYVQLTSLMQACKQKWSSDDAKAIFDAMLSILARYRKSPDADSLLPILIIIVVISCNISGQSDVLLVDERMENSDIGYLFKKVLHSC